MKERITLRGEAALATVVIINSFGVVLMLKSGAGIAAVSSVAYALSEVLPVLSLGMWNFLFQTMLVISLMVMQRKIVLNYLFSFVVGFAFGAMMDIHRIWVSRLPDGLGFSVLYFCVSWLVLCFGIALSNYCKMPIMPTDLFPRELSAFKQIPFPRVKITFDVTCVTITALLTFLSFGEIRGLGIGTVAAAFTMGKGAGVIGDGVNRRVRFISVCDGHLARRALLMRIRAKICDYR